MGEAERASEGLRDEFLAALAGGDGDAGDGGAVFGVAVEEHAHGDVGAGGDGCGKERRNFQV